MHLHKDIKKIVVYIFLYSYALALFKPIMPVVEDMIAHTFFKMEHLATVHFENGKYHVHMQLANEARQQSPAKGTASEKEALPDHLVKQEIVTFNTSLFIPFTPVLYKTPHPQAVFQKNPTPPPEA